MRVALAVAIPLAAALLQGSVVPLVSVAGAHPNLVVLAAASWAVAAGAREAVWWAFLGGLVADLLSGGPLGALALASLVPVAAVGLSEAQAQLRPRSIAAGAILVGAVSLVAALLYLAILALAGTALGEAPALVGSAVATAAYNGVLALAVYPLFRTIRRSTEKQASFGW